MADKITIFTDDQLEDWKAFEKVRKSGKFNMFDPRARTRSGLRPDEYSFCMHNYSAMKQAVDSLATTSAEKR